MKQVVVFGSKAGEDVIGDMIEANLPVEVIKVETQKDAPYHERTESEIREWTEAELSPFIGCVDVIVLCEPEIAFSSSHFLRTKYPDQKFVSYGQSLPRLLQRERRAKIILSHATRRMTRYQEIKSACFGMDISEGEYDPSQEISGPLPPKSIEEIVGDFLDGTLIIYTPSLIFAKEQLKQRLRWRASVIDMRESLFRETCAALKFRGLDGRQPRELEG